MNLEEAIKNREDCLKYLERIGQKAIPDCVEAVRWSAKALKALRTISRPSEWVSMETPPTTQGWYHIAVLDLKTGKYTVEQDLYAIELAKTHGFEPGFCKANRWKERDRIDYWCRFPAPPGRRPLEGEA